MPYLHHGMQANLDQRSGQEDMYWNSVSTQPFGKYPRKNASKNPADWDYRFSNLYQDTPKGKFPKLWQFYLARPCNHCANPACLPACPTRSIYKTEDGVVLIDQNTCEGFQNCVKACPYDKIYYNAVTKKSNKCMFCFPSAGKGTGASVREKLCRQDPDFRQPDGPREHHFKNDP
jgi:nitrate reductase beta subunit